MHFTNLVLESPSPVSRDHRLNIHIEYIKSMVVTVSKDILRRDAATLVLVPAVPQVVLAATN